jgi:hypothetical protein
VPSKSQCKFSKSDGTRCKAGCLNGSDFCFFHDPSHAQQCQQARRKGGKARSKPIAVLPISTPDQQAESVEDVVRLLGVTINEVRKGQVDPKIANATGYLSSVLLRALEGSELAKQIEEHDAALAAVKSEMEAMRREYRHAQTAAGTTKNGAASTPHGDDTEPGPGSDSERRSGDISAGGNDAGSMAGDFAPFFE